jgi:hypothetical protein
MAIQTPHVRSFFEQTGSLPVIFGMARDFGENNKPDNTQNAQKADQNNLTQYSNVAENADKRYLQDLLEQLKIHQEESNKHFTLLLQKQAPGSSQQEKSKNEERLPTDKKTINVEQKHCADEEKENDDETGSEDE